MPPESTSHETRCEKKITYRNDRSDIHVRVLPHPPCGVGLIPTGQTDAGLVKIGVCHLETFHSGGDRRQWSGSDFTLDTLDVFHLCPLPAGRAHWGVGENFGGYYQWGKNVAWIMLGVMQGGDVILDHVLDFYFKRSRKY
jgi:hypothetical protein